MQYRNILIIKCGAIGDVLRTTSLLKGLKERYPHAHISWLTYQESYDVLAHNPFIDEVLIYTQENKKDFCSRDIDLLISLEDEQSLCELASRMQPKKRIGSYRTPQGELMYTQEFASYFDMGLISQYGKQKADFLKKANKSTYQDIITQGLGISNGPPILEYGNKSRMYATECYQKWGLCKTDKIVGFNTGAGKRWIHKRWSEQQTAQLIDRVVQELGVRVMLFGGREEQERNERIKRLVHSSLIDAGCENRLLDFFALIDLCDVLLSSDSLALHVGIALKKYVVAFFGPTSAAEIDVYGKGEKIIAPVECACCYQRTCDKMPHCMDLLQEDGLFEGIKRGIHGMGKR